MDDVIAIALERPLRSSDFDGKVAVDLGEHCDTFARRVVERYLAGDLPWSSADVAMNHLFGIMTTRPDGPSSLAWKVYLAFDEGEHHPPGGDTITKPLLAAAGLR